MKVSVAQSIPAQWNRDRIVAALQALENQLNLLAEGRITGRHFSAASIPTVGAFSRGDIVWNSTPSAGGTVGWICVSGGEPGTFKTFGAIAA